VADFPLFGEKAMIDGGVVTLPAGVEIRSFRPVAYYDKHLDCIRVITHDRSVTEHRIDGTLTILECNHRGQFDPEYVGFTIKGVNALFNELGLSLDNVYRVVDLIDRMVSHRPTSSMSQILKLVFKSHEGSGDLSIDFREAA
jgi:hypothetical protein